MNGAPVFSVRRAAWFSLLSVACAGAQPPPEAPPSQEDSSVEAPAPAPAAPVAQDPDAGRRIAALKDPSTVEQGVNELMERYKQVARNGSQTPEARAFVDQYAEALATAYVDQYAALQPKTRLALSTQLLSFADPRTVPAHAHALQVYGKDNSGTDDAIAACLAAQRLKDDRFAPALMAAFAGIQMATDDGNRLGRHLLPAMVHNASPSWVNKLREYLSGPIQRPGRFDDRPAVKRYQNQLYWQTSAARLLGVIGDGGAARDLVRALLDNSKQEVHANAEIALVQLGKASARVAIALLTGEDAELVQAAKQARSDVAEPQVYFASNWLERLGDPSSVGALTATWSRVRDAQSKVLIAIALTHFDATDETMDIFRKSYLGASLKLSLPAGESALEALIENSPYLFKPDLAPWLMDQADRIRGAGPRKGDLQRTFVVALAKLITSERVKEGNRTSQKYGGRVGTPAYERAAELVGKCSEQAKCYLDHLGGSSISSDLDTTIALKCLVMVGAFGSTKERDALVSMLPKFTDPQVTSVVARVLAHLSDASDKKLADAIDTALGEPSADPRQVAHQLPLRLLAVRLRG